MESRNLRFKAILLVVIALISTNIKAIDYYLMNNAVAVTVAGPAGAWTQDPTGAAYVSPPANFNGVGNIWHFANRAAGASLVGNFGPPSAATVVIEAGFNLTVTGAFGQLNEVIWASATGTLTLANNKTYNLVNLDPNSTVIYSSSASTAIVQNGNYGNLVIAATTSFSNSASNVWVYGDMTINAAKTLSLNGQGLRLNSYGMSIAGSGSIHCNGNAFIECYGGNGGNNGTLNFTSGSVLDYMYIQFDTGTDYISLGSNLRISLTTTGTFFQAFGSFNLNGKSLTIDNTSDLSLTTQASDGTIMGSNTSALFVSGTIGVYSGGTSIFMDPATNTLNVLSLNSANTLDAGNALNITDSLSILGGGTFNTNNFVTLKSSSAKKGRLGRVSGTLGGNLTVQTFALGGITDWAVLGVSGIAGRTIADWEGQIPMTCNSCPNSTTSTTNPFASAVIWDESAAASSSVAYITMNYSDPLNVGQGYWIYLGDNFANTGDMTWNVTGPAVTGGTTIPLTFSGAANGDGYNLVSNPYASPISWAKLHNGNANVDDATYIYNADLGLTTSYVASVQSNPGVGANDVIPMGQGFYVRATANTNLVASESIKTTSSNQLLRSASSSPNNSVGSVIYLNVDGGGYTDATAIRFHSNATSSFDKTLDAFKLYASPGYEGFPGVWTKRTVIGTQLNNQDYSINSVPYAQTQNAVIPVVVRVYTSGQYTITGTDLQNIPPNACVTLFDKVTNTTHNLRTSPYVCNINDTTYAARFVLTVCQDVTADVKSQAPASLSNSIFINKDASGVYVDFDFNKATNANILVTNVLGQRIMDTKKVKVTNDNIYLDLNVSDQLIFVTVETENEKVTKKFLNFR